MEPQARYTFVGIAVLALAALVAGVFAWLLSSGNGGELRRYTVYFAHQSLDGLEPNSAVRMKGIRIGSVARFGFSARQPGQVEVAVDVDAGAPVRESTRAVVDRNLITGLASIRLVTLQEDSPLNRSARPGDPSAVIAEGESQLMQVTETMNQLAQRADETLRRISATLSPENQAAVSETLDNLRLAARQADTLARRSGTTLASVEHAAQGLQTASSQAMADFHRLADRYAELGMQTGSELHDAVGELHRLGDDMSRLSTRAEDFVGDAGTELRFTSQQIRSAADSVRATTQHLDDPRAALFGPAPSSLGPGEAKQ